MTLRGKKVVVTGAAGFIGSNLTDKLLELGANVIGIDNFFNGNRINLESALKNKNFQFYRCDIRDLNFLLEISRDVDIIYHQAAFTSVPQSILMPETCSDVNINGTLNILNIARKNDIKKVIFASSSSVYGNISSLPSNEEMERKPISPYGVTKLTCESYMLVYSQVYGINTLTLRYFNIYGPRQKDSPYSGVIAIWLGRIRRNEDLIVFGDGNNIRDFTYVKDVVQANILAGKKDLSGEILNIGAGSPITLTELAKLMLKISNKENLKIRYTEPRAGDIINSYADISKAKKVLGFQPQFNQEEGLKDFIKKFN